jgi:hypothetical protein
MSPMENESWALRISGECPFVYVYPAFLEHLSPIGIKPEQIKERVLVIGHGGAFPEKSLICTPESCFTQLRDEVETVFCCDDTYPSYPENIEVPCVNTLLLDLLPEPNRKTVYYEPSSCYTFLKKVKGEIFDSVLMFRVVDLGEQIDELGLIKVIAPHIKRGGYFICSGGRFPPEISTDFYEPLTLVSSVMLPNFSDGYPFTRNTGVILQKK